MQRSTISAPLVLTMLLVAILAGLAIGAPAEKSTVVSLHTSGAVTSPSVIEYRWADIGQNSYAQTYAESYSYDDAVVTVSYETGEPTFTGHLSAANLKPNFAYQLKIIGKPEALFPTDGDDIANENIGYAGRWWEVAPGTGNRTDSYYETYKDNPAYIFEAYLLFDFFLTGPDGSAELDFALDTSYHVLFGDWQGSAGGCNQPLKTTIVSGSSTDDAYDTDIVTTEVGVWPQIERLCVGETALPQGLYKCRVLLTEESFHTSDGNWAPAMINDDLEFTIGTGLFPPPMSSEPTFTAGTDNTVSWNSVSGATEYYVECSTVSNFMPVYANSGWTAALSYLFTPLADGQIYYYRVMAHDGTKTDSSWSATVSSTQDATTPASSVGSLPASHTGSTLSIPYTASDATSGVDFVELFYRVDGGAYVQYGEGFTSSPINFTIPGDGDYDFYTVATDNVGYEELPPGSPDASSHLTVGIPPDPVANPDYIDIGFLDSETGHALAGWGPIEPDTHGGGWGGIGSETPPGKCRTTWSLEEDDPVERWATLALDFGPASGTKTLWIRHLDGGSEDSFDVSVGGTVVSSIPDNTSTETWFWTPIDVTGHNDVKTVMFEATGDTGTYFPGYGQLAIDIISICGASALFEALPADAAPITCGQSKDVDFHFTLGCEYIRGYSLRVRGSGGLSFDAGDVTVHDPSGTGNFTPSVNQNATDDWTISYTIDEGSVPPTGIPSDVDLFTIEFQGASDGTGQVIIESVTVDPILQVPPPVLESVGATITVDCASPAGGFQINGGATATNDLDVNLDSAVTDATPVQMRFVNAPDTWSGPEDGWVDYAEVHFWTLASGPDGVRTVNAEYRDAVGNPVLPASDTITYTSNGPAAVTALNAEPGHREIVVSWQDPPDVDIVSLEIWRGLWTDDDLGGASAYPEYGGLPNDVVPTRPVSRAGALASPEWELAGTVLPGEETFTDTDGPGGLERGIYDYEVFAEDADTFYGPRAAANARATSYLLGDLDGDGVITVGPDITAGLSLCYGTGDGLPGYDNECDVGPTNDYTGTGIPQPDDAIDFSDLMIFALNFDTVFTKAPTGADAFARFAWTELETGVWSLSAIDLRADLKGLRLTADLPPGAVLSLSAGELLAGQARPFFLRNIDRNGLDAGLALLGDGARIRGEGELLRVTLADGHDPAEAAVDARDARNTTVPCTVEVSAAIPATPVLHRASPNYPNPFNPATRIEFELPTMETVELAVYRLDGRRVATLVGGVLPAGRHAATWDGRDERGEAVASGTYVYRLKAGAYTRTCKMTLLK